MKKNEHQILNWEDMSEEDKAKAMSLLTELNNLFDKYTEREDPCDDSTSTE